jgi:hypothetical protein
MSIGVNQKLKRDEAMNRNWDAKHSVLIARNEKRAATRQRAREGTGILLPWGVIYKTSKSEDLRRRMKPMNGPQVPYSARKSAILALIEQRSGKLPVNNKWQYHTNQNNQFSKDCQRMIKDGDAKLIRESRGDGTKGQSYLVRA